jgi:hypothetical protein
MSINLVFNYVQKTGEFHPAQNDCPRHRQAQEINKVSPTVCNDNYQIPKYKPTGKFKLVQIILNSTDRGKSWSATDLKTKEYTIQKEFMDSKEGSDELSSLFVPRELTKDIQFPEEFINNNLVATQKYNFDNYPYQIRVWGNSNR